MDRSVQKGNRLHFNCIRCNCPVAFSLNEVEEYPLECPECGKTYAFTDPELKKQLHQFVSLCQQIKASEEILSETHIGITVDHRNIRVPFKILLTRFNSQLDLMIGDQPVTIQFRIEPLRDQPQLISEGIPT